MNAVKKRAQIIRATRPRTAFCSRTGDRWNFAIEFEGVGDPPATWNEWWGSLWLWVGGQVVGRPSEIEMVMTGFDSLAESAEQVQSRLPDPVLSSLPAEEALDLVMWARYGDDHAPAPGGSICDRAVLVRHEILPRLTGPFFDGWEGVLIETGQHERFIYRQEGHEVGDILWPIGTFNSVVLRARDEFKKLAMAGMSRSKG